MEPNSEKESSLKDILANILPVVVFITAFFGLMGGMLYFAKYVRDRSYVIAIDADTGIQTKVTILWDK